MTATYQNAMCDLEKAARNLGAALSDWHDAAANGAADKYPPAYPDVIEQIDQAITSGWLERSRKAAQSS